MREAGHGVRVVGRQGTGMELRPLEVLPTAPACGRPQELGVPGAAPLGLGSYRLDDGIVLHEQVQGLGGAGDDSRRQTVGEEVWPGTLTQQGYQWRRPRGIAP